jgi:hypothetical protein
LVVLDDLLDRISTGSIGSMTMARIVETRMDRQAHCNRTTKRRVIQAELGDLQSPATTAERADQPIARYTEWIDPLDVIAGGATAREENQ